MNSLLLLMLLSTTASAQSTEIDFPTPVRNSEITGAIPALDVGDPRLTRHFYALIGTPGDLVINVESRNLDGSVDLFTAGTLRPLAQVSLYAGGASSSASKTIYLKQREPLVLRVEARSPDENEGSYRIRFEGSFEAMSVDAPAPEDSNQSTPATASAERGTRRVTSVGGRIAEPEPTPAEAASASEPKTGPANEPSTQPATQPSNETDNTTSTTEPVRPAPRPGTGRSARTNRLPRARQPRMPRTPPTDRKSVPPGNQTVQVESGPPPNAPAPANARLIIETRDGMRIERFMSTVRRVLVENGVVVVVGKDGQFVRQPLANILRMSIEQ